MHVDKHYDILPTENKTIQLVGISVGISTIVVEILKLWRMNQRFECWSIIWDTDQFYSYIQTNISNVLQLDFPRMKITVLEAQTKPNLATQFWKHRIFLSFALTSHDYYKNDVSL